LKDPDSTYKPGDRGGEWIKLKPDYFDDHTTLDLIVLGMSASNLSQLSRAIFLNQAFA
jgi:ATP-dependent DNA ligase